MLLSKQTDIVIFRFILYLIRYVFKLLVKIKDISCELFLYQKICNILHKKYTKWYKFEQ